MNDLDVLIYDTKRLISDLSRIQNEEFDDLVKTLGLNKLGNEWLFDYVFNYDEPETFEEHLLRYNRRMDEMIN
jgi:hypothetical protein